MSSAITPGKGNSSDPFFLTGEFLGCMKVLGRNDRKGQEV